MEAITMYSNFRTEEVKKPTRGTMDSAGVDIRSAENIVIPAMESRVIKTGLTWKPTASSIPGTKYWLNIRSRSGMAFKRGIEATTAGVIDEDYRGEIKILLRNVNGNGNVTIREGDKIAQGVVCLAIAPVDVIVESDQDRGENGFGSTGD